LITHRAWGIGSQGKGKTVFAAIMSLISIPVMLLNFGGGIIGGVWLAVLGKWSLLGLGLASMFISSFGLGLALMPGLLFVAPGALALDRGKYVIGILCLIMGNLWTFAIMTVWCVGCFYVVFSGYYSSGSVWPYLLWAYGMATGPWTYMAARGGPEETGSTFSAFGACVGAIAIMGVIIFKAHTYIVDTTVAFCIPIFAVFILQTSLAFMVAREEARNKRVHGL
jgi:hypothetical protein